MTKNFKYTIFIHPDSPDGYYVTVPALPGCFSSGKTVEEAIANAKEAIDLHLEVLEEMHKPLHYRPTPFKNFGYWINAYDN